MDQENKSTTKEWREQLGMNVAKLIDVKTFITFIVIGCLVGLAWRQNVEIPSELMASVVSSLITYFFTKKVNEVSSKKE